MKTRHIFTYGSLMFAPVWQQVVRGQYRAMPACLADHVRLCVVGATYPGMIRQSGSKVEGRLYLDVLSEDLVRLDFFEGSEYQRVSVTVDVGQGTSVPADTYIYLYPSKLTATVWQLEAFDFEQFLGRYGGDVE